MATVNCLPVTPGEEIRCEPLLIEQLPTEQEQLDATTFFVTPPNTPPLDATECELPVKPLFDLDSLTMSNLKSRDIDSIRLFTNQHLSETYASKFFFQFLTTQGCICLQLRSSGYPDRILGVISGRISLDTAFGNVLNGHVYTLAVDDQFRRCGLGTKLVNGLEEQMAYLAQRANGTLGSLCLEAKSSETKALHFYQRLGFDNCGEERNYYRDGSACIKMKKKIIY